ncbi:MAG: T9SS C-terminal target domain-containing protein [Gemmatimonadetes bacterium]|nr:MAG: T9SS C-terminal target domain-containing protein [Gemmatimonadota bacterium]
MSVTYLLKIWLLLTLICPPLAAQDEPDVYTGLCSTLSLKRDATTKVPRISSIALIRPLNTLGAGAVARPVNYSLRVDCFPHADEYLQSYQSVVDVARTRNMPIRIAAQTVFRIPEHAIYDTLRYGGYDRTFLTHLPPNYDGSEETPLVIALHGGFGSAFNLQAQSLLSETADSAGFIVVYPEGIASPLGIRTWNAGGCCGYAVEQEIDDTGFINTLIDTLLNRYNLDPDRIFATGMSNGGMMAYRLACELGDRIAAIAPVAATMVMPDCDPVRLTPIIHFHSILDENVPIEGGIGNGISHHYNPPVDSVLNAWADVGNCLVDNDTLYAGDDYLHIQWHSCDDDAEIQLFVTSDGGHSWPGGRQGYPGADPPSEVIHANDRMWAFFQQHPLNNPVYVDPAIFQAWRHQNLQYDTNGDGIITAEDVQRLITRGQFTFGVEIYPNPFNPQTEIRFSLLAELPVTIHIYDIHGRLIYNLIENKRFAAGTHRLVWSGKNQHDQEAPSGVYLYRIETMRFQETGSMILLR